jgi:mycofactocin system creatininase family protein
MAPHLGDACWPEIAGARRTVLVVPLGATEQHGPHLPLDTDAFIATSIANRLPTRRPGCWVAPTITLGASGEHAGFPGTLSIGTAALTQLLIELVRDASRDWPAVLILNGHGGNLAALQGTEEVGRREGRLLRVMHLGQAGMDAHAGDAETSMMLALAPERVRLDRIERGATQPVSELLGALRDGGVRAVSLNGVLGDPTGATAERGAAMVDSLTIKALAAYDELIERLPSEHEVRAADQDH